MELKEVLALVEQEGNRKQFTYRGRLCVILRPRPEIGHLCGYINLKQDETYNGYDDVDIDVHGGWTFIGSLEAFDLSGTWIGFDCAHTGDLMPTMAARMEPLFGHTSGDVYRDMAYVEQQLKDAVDQMLNDKH